MSEQQSSALGSMAKRRHQTRSQTGCRGLIQVHWRDATKGIHLSRGKIAYADRANPSFRIKFQQNLSRALY
jgi:hypothetical protein